MQALELVGVVAAMVNLFVITVFQPIANHYPEKDFWYLPYVIWPIVALILYAGQVNIFQTLLPLMPLTLGNGLSAVILGGVATGGSVALAGLEKTLGMRQ